MRNNNKAKFSNIRALVGVFALIFALFFNDRAIWALSWDEFAPSVSETFSSGSSLGIIGLLGMILIVLIVCLIVLIFSLKQFQERNTRRLVNANYFRKIENSEDRRTSSGVVQRRRWYRYRTNEILRWSTGTGLIDNVQYKQDQLVDISAGGLCFFTMEKLDLNDNIKFLFDFGGTVPLSLNGQVVRVEAATREERNCYNVAIQFKAIREADRDTIITWIANNERGLIKNNNK